MTTSVELTRPAISAWVAAREEQIVALLCEMIACDSVTGREGPMAELCAGWLSDHGIESILQPAKDRFNALGVVGEGEQALVISGHLDTVPPNEGAWTHGPWTPVVSDGKVFGLGASDLHASIVGAYYAQLFVREQGLRLPGRLVSAFTIEEETTGDGTVLFLDWAAREGFLDFGRTAAVVTEPTGLDHMCLGNLGSSFLVLTVQGKGGHGSRPHLARNPILELHAILDDLAALQERWKGPHADPDFGHATLTPTCVSAGDLDRTNVIPERARGVVDCRLTPPLYADDLALFRQGVGEVLARHRGRGFEVTCEELYARAGQKLDRDHPLAQTVWKVLTGDLGRADAQVRYNPAGNDAVFLAERGIPTVNKIGPGLPACAHAVDEHVPVANLLAGVELYLWIALRHFGLVR